MKSRSLNLDVFCNLKGLYKLWHFSYAKPLTISASVDQLKSLCIILLTTSITVDK